MAREVGSRSALAKSSIRGPQVVPFADQCLHVPGRWVAAEREKRWPRATAKEVDAVLLGLLKILPGQPVHELLDARKDIRVHDQRVAL